MQRPGLCLPIHVEWLFQDRIFFNLNSPPMLRMPTVCLLAGAIFFSCKDNKHERSTTTAPASTGAGFSTVDTNVTGSPSDTALRVLPASFAAPAIGGHTGTANKSSRLIAGNKAEIRPGESVVLQATQGTRIVVPTNAFVLESNGKIPSGSVAFEISEYYKTSDILEAGLSTMAQGRMLETGGMLYLNASADGAKCRLANGKRIQLWFPNRNEEDGMQLFSGRQLGSKVDWVLQKEGDFKLDIRYSEDFERYWYRQPYFYNTGVSLKDVQRKVFQWPENVEAPVTLQDIRLHYVLNSSGKVVTLKVEGSPSPIFDSSIQASLASMPNWQPALCNRRPVSAALTQVVSYWWQSDTYKDTSVRFRIGDYYIDSLFPKLDELNPQLYFTSPNLGWVNCDRFYEDPREKIQFIVEGEQSSDMKMIFRNMRCIMDGIWDGEKTVFKNIPAGEPVTIISMRQEGEDIYFGAVTTNTNTANLKNLAYVRTNREGLKRKLKELDEAAVKPSALTPAGRHRNSTGDDPASAADLAFIQSPLFYFNRNKTNCHV
jgi:hypothetical protein